MGEGDGVGQQAGGEEQRVCARRTLGRATVKSQAGAGVGVILNVKA